MKKSKEKAENVVNPPRKPTRMSKRPWDSNQGESKKYPTQVPAIQHPTKFTVNVAQTEVNMGASCSEIRYLATAPAAPPVATSTRLTSMRSDPVSEVGVAEF